MPILTAQERLGTRVGGRYRVDRVLAQGGMSVLFEARDLRARRTVALKLLRAEDCGEERRKARFLQEMRLTAELRHPNVVDVFDLGEDETGVPYLVMELLHGRSLQAELDARGTLGFEATLSTLLPVMEALAVVHAAGVVHRDVKPDNIFLHTDPRGVVVPKLLDFGIAKDATTTLATRTGAVLGTPDYMAPEQLLAGVVGPSADIWAVGAVMYRALSGQTPFHAETSAHVIGRLTREAAPALRVPELASPICSAIDRALSRETSDRYPDMAAFSAALVLCAREAGFDVQQASPAQQAQHGSSSAQRTITAPSRSMEPEPARSRRLQRVAVAASGALLLLAVLGWWLQRAPEPTAARSLPAVRKEASAASAATAPRAAAAAPASETFALPDRPQTPIEPADTAKPAAAGSGAPVEIADAPARRQPRAARAPRVPRPSKTAGTAPPEGASAAPQTGFSKGLSAGDFPIAVVW